MRAGKLFELAWNCFEGTAQAMFWAIQTRFDGQGGPVSFRAMFSQRVSAWDWIMDMSRKVV